MLAKLLYIRPIIYLITFIALITMSGAQVAAQTETPTVTSCLARPVNPPPIISTPVPGDHGGLCVSRGELCGYMNSVHTCFDFLTTNVPLTGGAYYDIYTFPCRVCNSACVAEYRNCFYMPLLLKSYRYRRH